MKRSVKIIIVIVVVMALLLLFVQLTGFVVRNVSTGINSCADSDFGKEYFVRGSASGVYTALLNAEDFYEEDYCDGSRLVEYYCSQDKDGNGFMEEVKVECPSGCSEGVCLGEEVEVPSGSDGRMWIMILIVVALVVLGILAVFMIRGKKHEPNYYTLFILGIVWLPLGIATDNSAFFIIGLVFIAIGLVNRNKRETNRKKFKSKKRR